MHATLEKKDVKWTGFFLQKLEKKFFGLEKSLVGAFPIRCLEESTERGPHSFASVEQKRFIFCVRKNAN